MLKAPEKPNRNSSFLVLKSMRNPDVSYRMGPSQLCERWFINHEIIPINYHKLVYIIPINYHKLVYIIPIKYHKLVYIIPIKYTIDILTSSLHQLYLP